MQVGRQVVTSAFECVKGSAAGMEVFLGGSGVSEFSVVGAQTSPSLMLIYGISDVQTG